MSITEELFRKACECIPGGVNSPVRSFRGMGIPPRMVEKGQGAYIWDVEGKSYLDYVCSWGPLILGHNHPIIREAAIEALYNGMSFGAATEREVAMAEQITTMTGIDMVRMVNSGTEAVMSAIRLARGYTGRNKIIKFSGCYHGHCDSMLVQAGSGALSCGIPDSAGVTEGTARDTLVAAYNKLDEVEVLFRANTGAVAAVIVEPVAANMGVTLPDDGFLSGLRKMCDQYGAVLIFDEVITGFRLCAGGAQAYFKVKADLVTYGKIIGAGMPVGAYGGKKEIMACVSPAGNVYQAGTLSGNPVALAAGLAQLKILTEPGIYKQLADLGRQLREGLAACIQKAGLAAKVTGVGSLCGLALGEGEYKPFFLWMLSKGIYFAPSGFEAIFISLAHTEQDIEFTLEAFEEYLQNRQGGI